VTLTEFLLARIAEDEAVALEARDAPRPSYATAWYTGAEVPLPLGIGLIKTMSPARVLAECEAKRRIVGDFTGERLDADYNDCGDECVGNALHWVLRALALPYADHPDYDPAWRP
jgi:hypothetical protein